jgi:mono/diheme cytochrome c family protein
MRKMAPSALCLLGVLAAAPSLAAGPVETPPDAVKGKALAERLCTNCHLVGDEQSHANVDIPSFREIANQEGQTSGAIMARIIIPKHPMPAIPLEKNELADLAAYILTLRERD